MTEADMQTAVVIIRHGWADRIPAGAIESRVRQALPAITLEDLAAAFERAGLMAEADELRQGPLGGRRRAGGTRFA